MKVIKALLAKLSARLVSELPPGVATCERCRKTRCTHAQWRECQRKMADHEYAEKQAKRCSE